MPPTGGTQQTSAPPPKKSALPSRTPQESQDSIIEVDHSLGSGGSSSYSKVAQAEKFPDAPFPPVDPGVVHERSGQKGDGTWRPFFERKVKGKKEDREFEDVTADFAADVVRRIVLHPHPKSPYQKLTLAAFDLRFLSVNHSAGKKDVEDVGHSELAERAGLVPSEEQNQLLAVFNGGFMPRHGRWGMLSLGTQLVPAREDACTVAVLSDGTVKIAPWPVILKLKEEVVAYRQTPPCLVHEGEVHARLLKGDRRSWAGQQADRKTRRRSVVGLSKDGRTLMFGVGSETEPEVLAHGILHAGAHFAAQLDINWNWTRLFLFAKRDGAVKPMGSLMKDMAKDRGEYITRAGARGFFYLRRRGPAR